MSSDYLSVQNQIYIPDQDLACNQVELLQSYVNDVRSDADCAQKCTDYKGNLTIACNKDNDPPAVPLTCQFYGYNYDYTNQRHECQLYSTDGAAHGYSYPYNAASGVYGDPIQGIIPGHGSIGAQSCGHPPPSGIESATQCKDYCSANSNSRCPLSVATYNNNDQTCACLRFDYTSGQTGFRQF
jgi:hypothetical protein